MSKALAAAVVVVATACSTAALATNVGVVDMKKIFKSSEKVKRMNEGLKSQFTADRKKLMKLSDAVKSDVSKMQKNRSVMKKKDADALNDKVMKEGAALRKSQEEYQEKLMDAQKKAMDKFMHQLQSATKAVAGSKKMDIVMPKGTAVYAADSIDITDAVLKKLG